MNTGHLALRSTECQFDAGSKTFTGGQHDHAKTTTDLFVDSGRPARLWSDGTNREFSQIKN
jgi:hypothetical protein